MASEYGKNLYFLSNTYEGKDYSPEFCSNSVKFTVLGHFGHLILVMLTILRKTEKKSVSVTPNTNNLADI